jgi:hypothetical protein
MPDRALALVIICATVTSAFAQGTPKKTTPPSLPSDLHGVKIKLIRTPCFGVCPDYTVSIFGDGTVVYEGRRFVKEKGEHRSKVSMDSVRLLADRFVSSNFFTLRSAYGDCGSDLPTAVTSIELPDRSKTVKDCGEAPVVHIPSTLIEVEDAIDATARSLQWVGLKDLRLPQ